MKGGAVSRCREAGDCGDVLAEGGRGGAGGGVAQILNSRSILISETINHSWGSSMTPKV